MVDPISAATAVAASISAISSVIQAVKSAKEMLSEKQINDALRAAPASGAMASVMAKIIDPDYLEVLGKNLEEAKRRLLDALNDPSNTKQAKDQEIKIASSTICGILEQIKVLNGGVLPSEYEQLWAQHGCG